MPATVALLGTGTMGLGMGRRIASEGFPLTVWNRTRERAESLADVARVAGSVDEAVADAEIVLTMLYDADKASRTCFACPVREDCSWSSEKMNLSVRV